MDWTDVAKAVAPMAPALGGLLGGLIPFPGGALAGQMLGNVIAKQFGVPATPAAVAEAMRTNPNEVVLAKLTAAMEEAKAQWPALAEMEKAWAQTTATAISEVNQTMRVELAHQHWFYTGWRPCSGWLFDFYALAFGLMLVAAAILAARGNRLLLDAIKELQIPAASLLGALAAVVGVYIIGRSQEKAKAIETTQAQPAPKKK